MGHDRHVETLCAPTVAEYFPDSHAWHASGPVADVLDEYFPAVHCEHVDESAMEYDPATQVTGSTYESLTLENCTAATVAVPENPVSILLSVTLSVAPTMSYSAVVNCALTRAGHVPTAIIITMRSRAGLSPCSIICWATNHTPRVQILFLNTLWCLSHTVLMDPVATDTQNSFIIRSQDHPGKSGARLVEQTEHRPERDVFGEQAHRPLGANLQRLPSFRANLTCIW